MQPCKVQLPIQQPKSRLRDSGAPLFLQTWCVVQERNTSAFLQTTSKPSTAWASMLSWFRAFFPLQILKPPCMLQANVSHIQTSLCDTLRFIAGCDLVNATLNKEWDEERWRKDYFQEHFKQEFVPVKVRGDENGKLFNCCQWLGLFHSKEFM